MTRQEILKEIKRFFDVSELVCNHTYAKWGEKSWQFLDTNLLHCLLIIRRDIVKLPLYCNGNSKHQRGLRCNMCEEVKKKKQVYLSSHIFGKAVDLTCSVPTMTAEKMRQLIKANADKFPCQIRIEKSVNWLHFDVRSTDDNSAKVVEFDA